MKTTSDDIDIENLNLSIIDELLIFHQFAASDLPLKDYSSSETILRPDIFICCEKKPDNNARSVSIIEFKRPGPESMDDPIRQMYDTIDEITHKGITPKSGRTIRITDSTKFYCYAICDITKEIEKCKKVYGFNELKDNLGYYLYNPQLKASVQILAFDKIL